MLSQANLLISKKLLFCFFYKLISGLIEFTERKHPRAG